MQLLLFFIHLVHLYRGSTENSKKEWGLLYIWDCKTSQSREPKFHIISIGSSNASGGVFNTSYMRTPFSERYYKQGRVFWLYIMLPDWWIKSG